MYLENFSSRLKDLMELEGLSINALSAKTGVDRKSIRNWLTGKMFPSYDALIKLREYFKISIGYLLGMDDVSYSTFGNVNIGTDAVKENFHKNITDYFKKNELTNYAVSKEINIDQKSVANWRTIKSIPKVATLIKLSHLMNTSIDELFGLL